jgi:hypothetical protein
MAHKRSLSMSMLSLSSSSSSLQIRIRIIHTRVPSTCLVNRRDYITFLDRQCKKYKNEEIFLQFFIAFLGDFYIRFCLYILLKWQLTVNLVFNYVNTCFLALIGLQLIRQQQQYSLHCQKCFKFFLEIWKWVHNFGIIDNIKNSAESHQPFSWYCEPDPCLIS